MHGSAGGGVGLGANRAMLRTHRKPSRQFHGSGMGAACYLRQVAGHRGGLMCALVDLMGALVDKPPPLACAARLEQRESVRARARAHVREFTRSRARTHTRTQCTRLERSTRGCNAATGRGRRYCTPGVWRMAPLTCTAAEAAYHPRTNAWIIEMCSSAPHPHTVLQLLLTCLSCGVVTSWSGKAPASVKLRKAPPCVVLPAPLVPLLLAAGCS